VAHTTHKVNPEIVVKTELYREDNIMEDMITQQMIDDGMANTKTQDKIRYLRQRHNLSTAYIARYLGVTYQYVYKVK
jgi:DNA-binding transcriptional regulator YiaG